jgi:hypothetical protein
MSPGPLPVRVDDMGALLVAGAAGEACTLAEVGPEIVAEGAGALMLARRSPPPKSLGNGGGGDGRSTASHTSSLDGVWKPPELPELGMRGACLDMGSGGVLMPVSDRSWAVAMADALLLGKAGDWSALAAGCTMCERERMYA